MTPREIKYHRRRKVERMARKNLSILAREKELRKRRQRMEQAYCVHQDIIDSMRYMMHVLHR